MTVIKVAVIPEPFKDVDELLRADGGDARYEQMIAKARPAPSWMIDRLDQRHDLSTPNGAEAACEDIVDVLLRQHPVSRFRYARELAVKLDVSVDAVWEMLQETIQRRAAYWQAHPDERPALPPRQVRQFKGMGSVDRYGETQRFDCPYCGSEDGAKASKPLDLWHCVACDASGKASKLPIAIVPTPIWGRDAL